MRVATFRDTALNITYCFHPRRFPCQHQRLPTDLINFEGLLSEDERAVAERVRAFVQREIKPNVGRWFENAELPTEIFSKLASEGLFGMHLKGYGCAGLSAPQYGLAMQETRDRRFRHPLSAFVICCAALSLIILMQVKVKP